MVIADLKSFLDSKVAQYNRLGFIDNDPICIPHAFTRQQDIEIMAFMAAILAWGQRKTIINKCRELVERMDGAPYEFVTRHQDTDLKALLGFKHRTFNDTDLLYFIAFFKQHYARYESLEEAFLLRQRSAESAFNADYWGGSGEPSPPVQATAEYASAACYAHESIGSTFVMEDALNTFRAYFFSLPDYPTRTRKHISSPRQKSACKRLNMFLRWMVRRDEQGVDFGLWRRIPMSALVCPCDVHVERVARRLKLITRKQSDWLTARELTDNLLLLDPNDPVKYDFALFGLGVEGEL